MGEVVTVILLDIIPRMVLKLQHRGKDVMLGLLGIMSALVMSASIKRRVIGGSAVFVLMVLSRMTALTGSVVKSMSRSVMTSQTPFAVGGSVKLIVRKTNTRHTPLVLGGSATVLQSVRKRATLIALGGSADPLVINIVLIMI